MNTLWILGAGGLSKEVCWLALETGLFHVGGFIDLQAGPELTVAGKSYPVIPQDAVYELPDADALALGIGDPHIRMALGERFAPLRSFPNLIHPTVTGDMKGISMGIGNVLTSNVMLTTSIHIGNFNLFNLACTIGHDAVIGNGNIINPAANISGEVQMGNANLIGTNATILQGRTLGDGCTIGAGAVVNRDVVTGTTVVGVPAKPVPR